MTEAYPLTWPANKPRTPTYKIEVSLFRTSFAQARNQVINEVRLLGGKNIIISSNLPLKKDGFPYANQKEPDDRGVAVYFMYDGSQKCMSCDRWSKTTDNLYAIALCIGALRGLDRWGAKDMVNAAFQGFKALPAPSEVEVKNYFMGVSNKIDGRVRYLELCKLLHPDLGGSEDEFNLMKSQYEALP